MSLTYAPSTMPTAMQPSQLPGASQSVRTDDQGCVYVSVVKPLLDRSVAALLLVLTAPTILMAMLIVKLTSKGPALYSQIRLGQNGRKFRIYKIRSMRNNCEAQSGPQWCKTGDPRITPFGWFLRKSHIDELPQLWNVMKGDLSLVGPRPERPEIMTDIERAIPDFRQRLAVKPGITGLAQVQLPPDEHMGNVKNKLMYDLHYIEQNTPWLDMKIMISTPVFLMGMSAERVAKLFRFPTLDQLLTDRLR